MAGVTWHAGTGPSTPHLAVATEGRACPQCGTIFQNRETHCSQCGATRPAVTGLRFGKGEAEPYIMHVWETHPPGGSHSGASKETLRRELIDLGACTDRTLGACSPPGTSRSSRAGSSARGSESKRDSGRRK